MTTADQERETPAPCPFCGDAAFYHAIEPHEHRMSFGGLPPLPPSNGSHVIECCSCNAGMIADSKAEVFASWDRRTPSQPAAVKESLTVAQPAPAVPAGWRPISEAPEGKLIVAGCIDSEGQEQHDFDYLEDGTWMHWQDHYDHVTAIGGHGVTEQAPYTHFMDIAPIPAAPTPTQATV